MAFSGSADLMGWVPAGELKGSRARIANSRTSAGPKPLANPEWGNEMELGWRCTRALPCSSRPRCSSCRPSCTRRTRCRRWRSTTSGRGSRRAARRRTRRWSGAASVAAGPARDVEPLRRQRPVRPRAASHPGRRGIEARHGVVVYKLGVRRWPVGVGMVPRGEVGLIFAGAGLGAGVIAEDLYSVLVVVVMLTTFVAPPWLKALYRQ